LTQTLEQGLQTTVHGHNPKREAISSDCKDIFP